MQASEAYQKLAARSRAELEGIMVAGETPSWAALADWEYRGFNHPWYLGLVGIRKFVKYFFADARGDWYGCNTPVKQNGMAGDWFLRPSDERPKRFGFYRVLPAEGESVDCRYPNALLLDYGRGGNPRWEPARVLRDYIVRVVPGADDLLLGKAYVAIGPVRIHTNYFLLERRRRVTPAAALITRPVAA